jgi:hypothetical protein
MGSRKPFIEETANANQEAKISILVNAVYYFLESVFVVINEDHCRLVIIQNQKLIVDQCYDSLRGAKIAFYRMYKDKCCVKGLKTEWSISYSPDSRWLSEKLKTAMPQPIFQNKLLSSEAPLTNAI